MNPRETLPVLVFHSPAGRPVPEMVAEFAASRGLRVLQIREASDVVEAVHRASPAAVLVDPSTDGGTIDLCRLLKEDNFSAIVPVVFLSNAETNGLALGALEAGADEVLSTAMNGRERILRMQMALQRASRDVSVNPTTRLPGTAQIERDIAERLARGHPFAVCYADLDHFKEFNDCYGYNQGDRVVMLLSRILRDVVKARAPMGFIGHIGGDDFIFNLPLERMRTACEEILDIFDTLIPYQYSPEDRETGYIVARDRRGELRRIPIMTLSIGVVTNQYRAFSHTAEISEVATEMKLYAKTLTGSVYAVDRRGKAKDSETGETAPRDEDAREHSRH